MLSGPAISLFEVQYAASEQRRWISKVEVRDPKYIVCYRVGGVVKQVQLVLTGAHETPEYIFDTGMSSFGVCANICSLMPLHSAAL